MAYSNFSLKEVIKEFGLNEHFGRLFPENITPQVPSRWLLETLDLSQMVAFSSEKSRSELLVMPILLELKKQNKDKLSLFSGENLDALPERGLNGECDFILTLRPNSFTVIAPIFSVVEAKKNDIDYSLGQCAAQMLGAKAYNEKDGVPLSTIYGCVTTGTDWKFLKLHENVLSIDTQLYFINDLPRLLGVLQFVLEDFA